MEPESLVLALLLLAFVVPLVFALAVRAAEGRDSDALDRERLNG